MYKNIYIYIYIPEYVSIFEMSLKTTLLSTAWEDTSMRKVTLV